MEIIVSFPRKVARIKRCPMWSFRITFGTWETHNKLAIIITSQI
jgi:hypothetical protein